MALMYLLNRAETRKYIRSQMDIEVRGIGITIDAKHCWCSGIMQDSHSCDPGSIPGQCIVLLFFFCDPGSIPGQCIVLLFFFNLFFYFYFFYINGKHCIAWLIVT